MEKKVDLRLRSSFLWDVLCGKGEEDIEELLRRNLVLQKLFKNLKN